MVAPEPESYGLAVWTIYAATKYSNPAMNVEVTLDPLYSALDTTT
jgi:hypothetical protein